MEYQKELWSEKEEENEKKLREAGVTFYEPTTEELEEFRAKCQTLYDDPELGQPYADFVAKIRAVNKQVANSTPNLL